MHHAKVMTHDVLADVGDGNDENVDEFEVSFSPVWSHYFM